MFNSNPYGVFEAKNHIVTYYCELLEAFICKLKRQQ